VAGVERGEDERRGLGVVRREVARSESASPAAAASRADRDRHPLARRAHEPVVERAVGTRIPGRSSERM
jgi:hypothetical protein